MTMRPVPLTAMLASVVLIVVPAVLPPPIRLLWNASASVPVGLYAVQVPDRPIVGELVAIAPPEPLVSFLASRSALPRDVPLIKPVAALPGQIVCRHSRQISIDGLPRAEARDRDRLGRPLPVWQGCRTIADDELFLMNAARPDSLDGRYFGPVPRTALRGRAMPLWIPKEP